MEVIEVKKGSEGSSIDDEGYDANPQNGKDVEKYLEAGNDDMTAPVDVRISRSSEWGNLSFIHAFEQIDLFCVRFISLGALPCKYK